MKWINENKIILAALIFSLAAHGVMFFYKKQNNMEVKNQIVYLEIIEQKADTDLNAFQEEKVEKIIEKPVKKETAQIPKKVIPKQNKTKNKKTAQNKKQDVIKSTGENKENNQAKTYIKNNYKNIEKQIVSSIVYPARAKKLGIQGSGYLLIQIDNNGRIVSVQAFDFPNKLLSDAALKAAKKTGELAGHQMAGNVELKIPVSFYLR